MHEVLVNRLGLSLPRKSVVRLTDRPGMALDVYRGRKTTTQQQRLTENWRLLDGQTQIGCINYTSLKACAIIKSGQINALTPNW